MLNLISKLLFFEEKKKIIFFLFLSSFASLLEALGVILLFKLIVPENKLLGNFDFSNIFFYKNSIYILITFFFFKFIYLNIYSWLRNGLVFDYSKKNSEDFLKVYLNQNLIFFTLNNTSEFIRNIYKEIENLTYAYDVFLKFFGELIVFIFLLILLFYLNFQLTLILFVFSFILSFFFIIFFKSRLINLSIHRQENDNYLFKFLHEVFSSAREIKVFNLGQLYFEKLKNIFFISQYTNKKSNFFQEIPKNSFDFILILFAFFLIIYTEPNFKVSQIDIKNDYIILVLIASYRMLPGFLRIISFFNSLNHYFSSINILFNIYKKNKFLSSSKKISGKKFCYNRSINLQGIYFKYKFQKENLFNNLNIKILKNRKYLLTGESGCGKTTFVDILSGLIKIKKGTIKVDNKPINSDLLKDEISYMSQNSKLFDTSILENIVLGDLNNYDKKKLLLAIKLSESKKFINKLRNKINYVVGEEGIRLSGGQRQRILLARCLYSGKNIMILDEFISSIDDQNSKKILASIRNIKDKTIILILHKYKKLNFVDFLVNFKNNRVIVKKIKKKST